MKWPFKLDTNTIFYMYMYALCLKQKEMPHCIMHLTL